MEGRGLKPVRARWNGAILVCGKCSKKVKGGFGRGGRKPLAKALRKHCRIAKGHEGHVGIVETKCLDICPKGAVVALNSAQTGLWHIVQPGADLDEVAHTLNLDCPK